MILDTAAASAAQAVVDTLPRERVAVIEFRPSGHSMQLNKAEVSGM